MGQTLSETTARTILTDEPVSFLFIFPPSAQIETIRSVVVQQQFKQDAWEDRWTVKYTAARDGRSVSGECRLKVGGTALRGRVDYADGTQAHSAILLVSVLSAPQILTCISMGGSSVPGLSGSSSSSSSSSASRSSGSPDASADISAHGITVDSARCLQRGFSPQLIEELITNRNIQCNNLCDVGCTNFIEHLGERLMFDELLANELKSIAHATFCHERSSNNGILNRIILGKWENSELEPMRPPGIMTFEDILDRHRQDGHQHVILVGNSQGGAKFAEMIRDHWRWDQSLTIALFVSWDSTHAFGGITSVGNKPRRVVNFFQTANLIWFQNGARIQEADEEFDLTNCFSHNAVPRSAFVHDSTVAVIRDAIARIRDSARITV